MADPAVQNFENHVRRVPNAFAAGALLVLVDLAWSLYRAVTDFSGDHVMAVVLALATGIALSFARTFALRTQDRIVRLETRLRLAQLLPADLQPRIKDLTVGQLVALRFASDAELPDLTRRVLTDNVTDRTAIKKMIKTWEADWLRV